MADITVTATRTALSAPVSVQAAPVVQVSAVSAQAPQITIGATIERKTVSVAIVPNGSGVTRLQDDLAPTLGGDLNLNGFTVLGLLDCGLL